MSCRFYKVIFQTLLTLLPSTVFAATDGEISSEFLYCAAVFNAGQAVANNPAIIQYTGRQYTKYLVSSVALASGDYVKEQYNAAVERYNIFLKESANDGNFGKKLSEQMNFCDQTQKTYQSKIDSYAKPTASEGVNPIVAIEGTTSPLEALIALGKPEYETYNADGQFTYLYPTSIGKDVYLFDRFNKLVRLAKYCES